MYRCTQISPWIFPVFVAGMGVATLSMLASPAYGVVVFVVVFIVLGTAMIAPAWFRLAIRSEYRITPAGLEIDTTGPFGRHRNDLVLWDQCWRVEMRRVHRPKGRSFDELVITMMDSAELKIPANETGFAGFFERLQDQIPRLDYIWVPGPDWWRKVRRGPDGEGPEAPIAAQGRRPDWAGTLVPVLTALFVVAGVALFGADDSLIVGALVVGFLASWFIRR